MEEIKREIKRLYNDGMPIEGIVRACPCRMVSARKLIKEMRENGELSRKRNINKISFEKIQTLLEQGFNKQQIANELNLSMRTVNHYLHSNGVCGRLSNKNYNKSKRIKKTYEIMEEIKKGEKTYAEIGRQFGFSRQYVHKLANELKE